MPRAARRLSTHCVSVACHALPSGQAKCHTTDALPFLGAPCPGRPSRPKQPKLPSHSLRCRIAAKPKLPSQVSWSPMVTPYRSFVRQATLSSLCPSGVGWWQGRCWCQSTAHRGHVPPCTRPGLSPTPSYWHETRCWLLQWPALHRLIWSLSSGSVRFACRLWRDPLGHRHRSRSVLQQRTRGWMM